MVINCFWVAGQYKGKGNGKRLIQQCIDDAKGTGGALFRNLYQDFLKEDFVCNLCRPKKAVVFSFLQS